MYMIVHNIIANKSALGSNPDSRVFTCTLHDHEQTHCHDDALQCHNNYATII